MVGEWAFWAVLSAVFAAAVAVLAKAGSADIDPDLATLVRTAVVLLVLVAMVTAMGKWTPDTPPSSRTLVLLVLSALATGASWLCYFRALKAGEAAKVNAVDKLSVVLVAVFAVVFLREKLTARDWLGVGLVAAGVLTLALKR